MKSNELRTILATSLKGYNAYFGINTGVFDNDYKINYNIANSILLEGVRTYVIDVDVWHKDNVKIDTLTDEIEEIFNYSSLKKENWCTFFLENRVNADEKNLYRRTLTYEVRTY